MQEQRAACPIAWGCTTHVESSAIGHTFLFSWDLKVWSPLHLHVVLQHLLCKMRIWYYKKDLVATFKNGMKCIWSKGHHIINLFQQKCIWMPRVSGVIGNWMLPLPLLSILPCLFVIFTMLVALLQAVLTLSDPSVAPLITSPSFVFYRTSGFGLWHVPISEATVLTQ